MLKYQKLFKRIWKVIWKESYLEVNLWQVNLFLRFYFVSENYKCWNTVFLIRSNVTSCINYWHIFFLTDFNMRNFSDDACLSFKHGYTKYVTRLLKKSGLKLTKMISFSKLFMINYLIKALLLKFHFLENFYQSKWQY